MRIVHVNMDSQSALKRVLFTIELSEADVYVAQRGIYTSVTMTRSAPRARPGEPALPWRKLLVYIPDDARVVGLQVDTEALCTIPIATTIEPVQPEAPIHSYSPDNKPATVGPDPTVYSSTAPWPAKIAHDVRVRRLGNKQLALVEICPFRYQPLLGKLELAQRLKVELTFRGGDARAIEPEALSSLRFETRLLERLKQLVVNPEHVTSRLRFDVVPRDLTRLPDISYVIVTSAALASSFEPLAQWRSLQGLRARVVSVEDICNNSVPDTNAALFWVTTDYPDGGTRDAAEAIRNFVKWAAKNWGTEFVLLGGDTAVIPARMAWMLVVGDMPYGDLNVSDMNRNLALEASCSSARPNCVASNVLDDNPGSYWSFESSDRAPWLSIGFGSVVAALNRVQLTWGVTSNSGYSVQLSKDGVTWQKAHAADGCGAGLVDIALPSCESASQLRIVFHGRAPVQLQSVRVFGPCAGAYRMNPTCTRVSLNTYLEPNPSNSPDGHQVVIVQGEHKGTVIPYNLDTNATTLGWRHVEDLLRMPAQVSSSATQYIEVSGPAEFHGAMFFAKTTLNYIPTDLYYADLDSPDPSKHDWDADNNGIYGERYEGEIDGVNGLSDVFVGRIPVTTTAQVSTVVEKIRRYESYRDATAAGSLLPMSFATSALLAASNWADPGPGMLDGASACNEEIRHVLLASGSSWEIARLYEDLEDVAAADITPDLQPGSTEAVKAAIALGHNVVSLVSHGSPSGLCYLSSGDVDDEANIPSVWYGNACSTNSFDETTFSEFALLNPNGGAVAYLGNSRFGWTNDGPMERAFWEEMFDSGRLGPMLQSAHLIGGDWQKYSMNLMGDPALRVWSASPKALSVAHAATIDSATTTQLSVKVTADGAPVSQATVCAAMTDDLHCVSTTDDAGLASLSVRPSAPGTLQLTVSGQNLLPYLGTVRVKLGKPGLTLSPLALEFGKVALGKSSTLSVKLTNPGAGPLYLFVAAPSGSSVFRWRPVYGRKLSPGASTTIAVSVSPKQLGVVRGNLVIASTSAGSPHTVGLSVYGVELPAGGNPSS